jgi:hypothetical protein
MCNIIIPEGRQVCPACEVPKREDDMLKKKEIYSELLYANKAACTPPLPESEAQTIANSVSRYKRKGNG